MTDSRTKQSTDEKQINKLIGQNIRNFRKENGMSQKHLAERLGLSPQGLLKIEKGIVSTKVETIKKIMDSTGLTPNQIFGVEEICGKEEIILKQLVDEIKKNTQE